VTGAPLLGFLEAHQRPLALDWMEFHRTHTQGFIPLGGASFIIAVAPPDTPPGQLHHGVRGFFMDGSCGVILHERTWHHVLFPLAPRANAIVLLQEGVREHDMNTAQLDSALELVWEA
jgi:ureidoglycolate hydrolase